MVTTICVACQDAVRGEKQANTEADDHQKRAKESKDAALKKEAEDAEKRARLRAKGVYTY